MQLNQPAFLLFLYIRMPTPPAQSRAERPSIVQSMRLLSSPVLGLRLSSVLYTVKVSELYPVT